MSIKKTIRGVDIIICDYCGKTIFDPTKDIGRVSAEFGTCDICGKHCCSEHITREECYIYPLFERVCLDCAKNKDIIKKLKDISEQKEALIDEWKKRARDTK